MTIAAADHRTAYMSFCFLILCGGAAVWLHQRHLNMSAFECVEHLICDTNHHRHIFFWGPQIFNCIIINLSIKTFGQYNFVATTKIIVVAEKFTLYNKKKIIFGAQQQRDSAIDGY